MSQVSRPVQIALVAVVLGAALWFFALRPKPQTSTASAPVVTTPAPAPTPTAAAPKNLNTKTPVVGGLLGAVNKANGAVATSQANASQLERQSNAASSSSPTAPSGAGAAAASTPATGSSATSKVAPSASQSATGTRAPAPTVSANPAIAIKNELAQGKTVVLLFWNPLASDDVAVHAALQSLVKGKKNGPLVAAYATANQVADYGSIVTASQVLETPSLLIMKGKSVQAITDLQDPADLRQYIGDIDQGGPGQKLLPTLTAFAPTTTRAVYVARENKLCGRIEGTRIPIPTNATAKQAGKAFVTGEDSFLNQVAAIAPPRADAAYIHHLIALERRADREVGQAFSATSPTAFRNLILSAETNDDYASSGLENYGLVSCILPASR